MRKKQYKIMAGIVALSMLLAAPVPASVLTESSTIRAEAKASWVASGILNGSVTWKLDSEGVLYLVNGNTAEPCSLNFAENAGLAPYLSAVREICVEDVIVTPEVVCDGMTSLQSFNMALLTSAGYASGGKRYSSTFVSFKNCKALKEINLSGLTVTDSGPAKTGNMVLRDNRSIFSGCDSLTRIVMPSSGSYCAIGTDTGEFVYEGNRYPKGHYPAVYLPTGADGYGQMTEWQVVACPNKVPKGPKGNDDYLKVGDYATMSQFVSGHSANGEIVYYYPAETYEYKPDKWYASITSYEWGCGQTYELRPKETGISYSIDGYVVCEVADEAAFEGMRGKLYHVNDAGGFDHVYSSEWYNGEEQYYVRHELKVSDAMPVSIRVGDVYNLCLSDIIDEENRYCFVYGYIEPTLCRFDASSPNIFISKDILKDLTAAQLNRGLRMHLTYVAAPGENPPAETAPDKAKKKKPVAKVTLNKSKLTLKKGKSYRLKATVTPKNDDNKNLKWMTSNSKIATVSASGKVKAKKKGTVKITVKALDGSKKKFTCKVRVR